MTQNNYNGALQKPIGSGFNAASTTDDVINGINLSGKTAIITGGYSGLGLEITKTLSAAGATIIVPAKDSRKATENIMGLRNVSIESLDLANPTPIDLFAQHFLQTGRPLDLLINNAGIMWTPLLRDERGNELQFSTNHLGHFQLTARLWPALKKANSPRVVNVSSSGHYYSPIHWEDPNYRTRPYDKFEAYGQAKTANILFTVELDKRASAFGVRAYSLHPGVILETNLGRHLTFDDYVAIGTVNADGTTNEAATTALKKIQKTPQQGAATTVWAATNPLLTNIGGVYCEDAEVAGFNPDFYNSGRWQGGIAELKGVAPFALEQTAAQALWRLSEKLIALPFNVN